jgi:hypothetical protein
MRIFFAIILFNSSIYAGFVIGQKMCENGMIEKIIRYSCDVITDRKSYDQCIITVREKFLWKNGQ